MDPRVGSKKAIRVRSMTDREFLEYVIHKLTSTLLCNNERGKNGYSCTRKLARDFENDHGLCSEIVAQRFGFASFEQFVKSPHMKSHVEISLLEDNILFYSARLNNKWDEDRLAPLLKNIQISSETVTLKKERSEKEKYARAMAPENRGKVLEGRKLLAELVHLCGGEEAEVNYQKVRDAYTRKTGEDLNKNVIKSYFQRDKISRVILDYCHNEIVLSVTNDNISYLKLRKPYKDILQSFTDLHEQQQNPPACIRNSSGQDRLVGKRPIRRPRETFQEPFHLNMAPVLPAIQTELFTPYEDHNEDTNQQPKFTTIPQNTAKLTFRDTGKLMHSATASPDPFLQNTSYTHTLTTPEQTTANLLREELDESPDLPPNGFSMRHKQAAPQDARKQAPQQTIFTIEDESQSEEEEEEEDEAPWAPIERVQQKPKMPSSNHQQPAENANKQTIAFDFWRAKEDDAEEQEGSPSSSSPDAGWQVLSNISSSPVHRQHCNELVTSVEPEMPSRNFRTALSASPLSRPKSMLTPQTRHYREVVVDEHRIREMANVISKIVHYRTGQTTKVDYLLQVLEMIDPDFKTVFQAKSLLEFVDKHCNTLRILNHEGQPIICCLD